MIIKIRKKPIEVTAIRWDGTNNKDVKHFVGSEHFSISSGGDLEIYNILEKQWINTPKNYYIIKGIKGEFYPCDPEVLHNSYDILG